MHRKGKWGEMYQNRTWLAELGVIKKNFFWLDCTSWFFDNVFFFTSVIKIVLKIRGLKTVSG